MIEPGAIQDLVGRWWWNYDQGKFDVLAGLLTEDMHFSCRTDTGATDFEEFVRIDISGRDPVMAWQTDHRMNSPAPLRHNGTNVHVVAQGDGDATFASYIFVTQIVDGAVASLSSGIVNGRVRMEHDTLRLAGLEVVLDTMHSVPLRER
jgi:hypothetical protein